MNNGAGGPLRAMPGQADKMFPVDRAREKEVSRREDEYARASGRKSASQLRQDNEVFGSLAGSARVRLAASRSLS